ncbi:NUDIX hydrolase [Chlorella sorokiniana]|uniref:NUDIX hydrolase n=1 Tax=Chlorella sorokiniana TaxID=3076 RepID=A0A2P6TFP7_CHLSO|nr:NUDIX hydrolase [Chlorella sorokiniana]|eukprot:PRW32938.1 NUDIX hydrolase [Chlorella sorokiniana]
MAEGGHTYKWPRPSLTVDAVIVAAPESGSSAKLLLIQRKHDPFAGAWALPGGFVDENEPLDQAAARELQEETGVNPVDVLLTQVGAFGDPGRDPRGWCVSVAYAALVPTTELGVQAADDAEAAHWYDMQQLPKLAFDHKLIVRTALRHLAGQEAVQQRAGLRDQLAAAAEKLEGPWQERAPRKVGTEDRTTHAVRDM